MCRYKQIDTTIDTLYLPASWKNLRNMQISTIQFERTQVLVMKATTWNTHACLTTHRHSSVIPLVHF